VRDGLKKIKIRHAESRDLPALTKIRTFYAKTNISFDEEEQTKEQQLEWFKQYSSAGPYRLLVAEEEGRVLGYVTSGQYRIQPVFRETIRMSIYVADEMRGKGLGTRLYSAIFDELQNENLHMAVVGIALPNEPSVALHKKCGFTEIGIIHEYAKKNGIYLSCLWMEKRL
jgi:phosphinothricin acetyltransferase